MGLGRFCRTDISVLYIVVGTPAPRSSSFPSPINRVGSRPDPEWVVLALVAGLPYPAAVNPHAHAQP